MTISLRDYQSPALREKASWEEEFGWKFLRKNQVQSFDCKSILMLLTRSSFRIVERERRWITRDTAGNSVFQSKKCRTNFNCVFIFERIGL